MSASLGLARWHMQNMQTSGFLHLLDHSSVSAVSWDVFRGEWHRTEISGIHLWRSVLSRTRVGVFLSFLSSCLFSSTCQVGHLDLFFLISHSFKFLFRWVLVVTSSPGRSLLSSTNECGVHVLVAIFQ